MVKEMKVSEQLKQYLNKNVTVAVPHFNRHNHLFWYSGILLAVDNQMLELQTKKGTIFISIDRIKEFREDR